MKAPRRARTSERSKGSLGVRPRRAPAASGVGFFLDDRRIRHAVDLELQRRAGVVRPIDRAREGDEGRTEIAAFLANADVVLDVPELGVHQFQRAPQLVEARASQPFVLLQRAQKLELGANVGELAWICNPLGLAL